MGLGQGQGRGLRLRLRPMGLLGLALPSLIGWAFGLAKGGSLWQLGQRLGQQSWPFRLANSLAEPSYWSSLGQRPAYRLGSAQPIGLALA